MEKLEQIKVIANNLKTGPTKAVKALHKLVFEREGDRGNRKRLREFGGFAFASGSVEYKNKLTYVDTYLGWGDLVAICNILAVDYAGTKKELGQRICDYLMDFDSLDDANDERRDAEEDAIGDDNDVREVNDDEDEDEASNEDEDDRQPDRIMSSTRNKFTMTFKDVEDSIRSFSGDEKYPVTHWISDFEEAAELYCWTDIQKLIEFAEKSLRGLARLHIKGERGLTSWKKLKRALQDEFSDRMNSAELHRQMDKRKMKVLTALRFYASGSYQNCVGSNVHMRISQTSVSRCIHNVTNILNLPEVFNTWVYFPNNIQELQEIRNK
ncbi:Protein DEK [Trachymyrmex cornetzi]|uniref:Protein DEK n=1 Tax=Trachymyrmex cornetzi TaxID=471704 RepID=A0A151JPY8_9HYME|nr:Protein DEK [Trachymyrmex cornetzi]